MLNETNNLRVNLEQVVILGVGSEEVGDANHSAAKGPPVLHATLVLLLTGCHPPYTTSAQTISSSDGFCQILAITRQYLIIIPIRMMCTTM